MLKRVIIVAALLPLAASVIGASVYAADPTGIQAIKDRQAILKGFGQATKPIGDMLKGAAPFDASVVKANLLKVSEGAKKLPTLFPDDSKTGEDTEALPKIWEEKDKFTAIYDKLSADTAAAAAAITDEASLKAQMPKVFGDCKTCHDTYRAKK